MLSQICSRVQRGAGQPNPGGVKCFGVDETGTGTLLRTKNKQTGKIKKKNSDRLADFSCNPVLG